MIKKILVSTLAAGFAASSAFAAWEVVDDFESYADNDALMAVWSDDGGADLDGEGAGLGVTEDFMDASNQVLEVLPGAATAPTSSYNAFSWRSIPPVSSGVATVYHRFAVPDVEFGGSTLPGVVDMAMGLSPVAAPTAYGDFSFIFRQEFDGSLDIYDTDTYKLILDVLPGNTWYEFWYVMDHGAVSGNCYIKGGPWTEQTKLVDDPDTTPFGWRNTTLDPITTFLLATSAGTQEVPKALDATLIDDIYIDTSGENLASPIENGGGGGGDEPNDLINISTRGLVGLGGEIMIAGFVSAGDASSGTVLIRGIGPTLGGFGVANTVEDPVLTVFRTESDGSSTQIATNDDWGDSQAIADASAAVGAFALEAGSADAALLLSGLTPGAYTVQLSGKGTTAQNGLIEVYRVD